MTSNSMIGTTIMNRSRCFLTPAWSVLLLLSFTGMAQAQTTVPGLIHLWSGEGNANDSVGTANGTLGMTTAFGTGLNGQAFSFNGAESSIVNPLGVDINPSALPQMTMGMWVKLRSVPNSRGWVIGNDNGGFDRSINLTDSRFGFGVAGGTGSFSPFASDLIKIKDDLDTWHCVAVSYDSVAQTATFYVDGFTQTVQANPGPCSVTALGGLANFTGHTVDGLVDEVFVFDRVLSAAELDQAFEELVNRALPTSCQDIRDANPTAVDGEYVIFPNDQIITVYCDDMAGTPSEYLTLTNTGGNFNYGQYTAGGFASGTNVRTNYKKVRLDPATLLVDIGDKTFSSSVGSLLHGGSPVTSMPYGLAQDCRTSFSQTGTANIDLTGTPFKIADTFVTAGFRPAGSFAFSAGNQVVNLTGGGACGWITMLGGGPHTTGPNTFVLDLAYIGQTLDQCSNADSCRFPQLVSGNLTASQLARLVGRPNDSFLGIGGSTVTFEFDCAFIGDGPGADFNVYEVDFGGVEFGSPFSTSPIDVLVSFDGTTFASVKSSQGPVVRIPGDGAHGNDAFARSYDLSGSGLAVARFVRIDPALSGGPSGCCRGFDLDAIGVINGSPDADGDGLADVCDLCPGHNDAVDTDADGTPDCLDSCPGDATKTDPGQCGCGIPDVDGDLDGVADCVDPCTDADGDGYGNGDNGNTSCPNGTTTDCNDVEAAINPGASGEVCNGFDNDCDGFVDEDFVSNATSCGVGACASTGITSCVPSSAPEGQFVRVTLPTAQYLSLAEVEVYSGGFNVAPGGTASQSSTGFGGVPSRAIDGNTSGVYGQRSVTHTLNTEPPTWIVDLGAVFQIDEIRIFNRTGCCPERLDNYTVEVLDADSLVVFSEGPNPFPSPATVHCLVEGGVEDSCTPGTPAADDATCDGVDDDCDNATDEDYVTDQSCFLPGACAADNAASICNMGDETVCATGTPAAEVCDSQDNDCDGLTDEDGAGDPLTQATSCGVGVCDGNTGFETCVDGSFSGNTCDPQSGSSAEICDTLDNDCDGLTDEGLGTTTCGLGACNHTIENCVDGVTQVCDPFEGDFTPPAITCPQNATLDCPADTSVAVNGSAAATDSCDANPAITSSDVSVLGCGNTETITRTWTATDASQNSASCDQIITVVDTTDPAVSCPANATLECPADTSVATNGSATATDNCDGVTITSSDVSLAECGDTETITRTWTATDDCGLTTSCDQTITVLDTTPPVLTVDTTPILVVDFDCLGDIFVTLPIPSATDTCGGVTITDDAPVTFPAGATTPVTFTATDDCGNMTTATVNVTVLFGADILVKAAKHTVGSGSHPGSTKEPFVLQGPNGGDVGIEVCAYDKADGSCARDTCGGISHQHYECIALGEDDGPGPCGPVNCCTTDVDTGECIINLPPGDYIVISADATKTVLPDPLGVSASDLECGELKQKHLQQIVKVQSDGMVKKRPGKTTRLTGSELLIIEPEFIVWDDTEQAYPFIFETIGDWDVTTSVAPPEGFVADYNSLSADVDNTIAAVQFIITEVGSDLVPTETTFEVSHNGQSHIVHGHVGIFLTSEYAQSRGFNVAVLRAQGLIKERPGNQGQGQGNQGQGHGNPNDE